MRCKPPLVLAILILCSLVFIVGCGGTGGSSASNLSTPPATNPSSPGGSSSQPGSGSAGSGSGSAGSSSGGSSSGGSTSSGGGSTSGGGSSSGSGSGSGSTGGTAQGGFAETKSPIPFAGQMLAADFNHDGRPDLLIYGSSLSVSLNNGAGNFSAAIPVSLPAPYSLVSQVALADFNADGYTDVAACVNSGDATAAAAAVFLNDHSGKLILGQVIPAPAACKGIAAGDANRDGKADLALTYYTGSLTSPVNAIATWFGDGAGHFASPVTQSNVALSATEDETMDPCSVAAATGADFDGDGTLDLVVFGACQSYVINPGVIYFARGDGTGHYSLTEITESTTSVYGSPYVKDINGDGKPDLVFIEAQYGPHASTDEEILFAINNGSGQLAITPVAAESSYASSGSHIRAGSPLNGMGTAVEGFLDVPCCASVTYGVKLVSQGTSDAAHTWTYGQSTSSLPGEVTGIASGDFDGNGAQDFAVAERDANNSSTLHVYLSK
ncbi:MAG: FG-GAP repeat domain-containing protein [Terriglobales bacterium]